jgi:hypothetical protein
MFFLLSSCVENAGTRSRRTASGTEVENGNGGNGSGGNGDGQGAGRGDGSIGSASDERFRSGRAEIRHVVDPFDGTYKTKVTIPKNFQGYFYLSGLNITSLSDRIITVRFKFGRDYEVIEVPATIGRGQGIIPQTDIEVIILDMNSRPFENLRLPYDLFDYNNYKDGALTETLSPTQDPRNGGLYCRGLNVVDDPTFEGSVNKVSCNQEGDRCLYSYAKIRDAGLFDSTGISIIPSEPQIDFSGNGLDNDSVSNALKKCLPEKVSVSSLNSVLGTNLPSHTDLTINPQVVMNGATYTYRGPYRMTTPSSWSITSGALLSVDNKAINVSCNSDFECATGCCNRDTRMCVASSSEMCDGRGPSGLFKSLNGAVYSESFLFPRAGKMELGANVEHMGSADPFDLRNPVSSPVSANSEWMDGCNMRVGNYDSYTNEGIGSCNVTASIELITRDPVSGEVEVIDGTSTNKVKIQIVRPSLTNYQGREVLYTAMKTCSSSKACGSGECCYNNRCWSKELVSQCLEDTLSAGNLGIGQSCSTDYQCSSFCCNGSTGTCAVHINTSTEQVLCGKSPGQQCVAKEWCRKEDVPECMVVKTVRDPVSGKQQCALRCYNVPTFGECRNGICIPPVAKEIPPFDPANPDCSNAEDPPVIN